MPATSRPRRRRTTVRLADYQPPPFLVDHVALDFDLDAAATRVTSRLGLRRNPAAPADAPLLLDGEALTLLRLARDGETLGGNQYRIEDGALIIPDMPDECELTIETRIAPRGKYRTQRSVRFQRQLLYPVRGGRFPTYHVFPRPART